MADLNLKLLSVFITGLLSVFPPTECGHFLNADGTPHDMYHELHVPRNPPLYPTYDKIPKTSFSCEGKEWGYHADTEAQCQVNEFLYLFREQMIQMRERNQGNDIQNDVLWYTVVEKVYHLCQGSLVKSFLCPNATLFHNQFKACDQFYNVRCGVDLEDL